MMNVYVASSVHKSTRHAEVVARLRQAGYDVYDHRNPPGRTRFLWSEVDPEWREWTGEEFKEALEHPLSHMGFNSDFGALKAADVCVLILPSGRDAHVEAGFAVGAGKWVLILLDNNEKGMASLMYRMVTGVHTNLDDLMEHLDCIMEKRDKIEAARCWYFKRFPRDSEFDDPAESNPERGDIEGGDEA